MQKITVEQLQKHIKTHTERSVDDQNAVTILKTFLRSDGKINAKFAEGDKWPNTDGNFELVPHPEEARHPKYNFVVQIKGTTNVRAMEDGGVKYQLKSLAFPAYVAMNVTMDPGILFLVVNPGKRGQERVFWKYVSPQFITMIDFSQKTATIEFSAEDEIMNTDESVNKFVDKVEQIADTHSYLKTLETREYSKNDILKTVLAKCENITTAIEEGLILNYSRDNLSKRIFNELNELCEGTLILNALRYYEVSSLRLAWEVALLDRKTKFLATFLQGLKYIGLRIPEEGQFERLLIKYYGFLWKIREYLEEVHGLTVLSSLEKFPREINEEDEEYNRIIADAIESVEKRESLIGVNRYYIQKKVPFYVGRYRYFEITLQLANKYATKYNRLTVYSKSDISTNYSIQVGCVEAEILLWDIPTKIKVVTDWRVSIEPVALNKLAKLLRYETKISSKYQEYSALMSFLTGSGMSLLDLIDMREANFNHLITKIYEVSNTAYFKNVLIKIHTEFYKDSDTFGKNTIRYILLSLREDLLEEILPDTSDKALKSSVIYLSKTCYTFEQDPILYNLPRNKTNGKFVSRDVLRAIGINKAKKYLPYIKIKKLIDATGELYFSKDEIIGEYEEQSIDIYNAHLSEWDKRQGCTLKETNGYVYIDEYVRETVHILQRLLELSEEGNEGQEVLNQAYVAGLETYNIDDIKIEALKRVFVNSKIVMIYGAAGTGKTTLMNYISNLMVGRRKLFLTKTHTALENLRRRIEMSGDNSKFFGIDQFINSNLVNRFEVVFIDECSTIDNRTMVKLLEKLDDSSLIVFAGDIYQIESIDFGNWFFYAKEILPEKSMVELNSTWRTNVINIKKLWEEVRFVKPLITEMLVIDGPFSENIGRGIFSREKDEVVLCLNYDGKFGLNSINSYFQDANTSGKEFYWDEWKYKVGDPVLFNDNKRFPMLYNNLKGTIVDIERDMNSITFTIDVYIVLTAIDVKGFDLEIVSRKDNTTRVQFVVYANDETKGDEDYDEARMKSIVPFQLAYAVSIHKAQGLEYDSVKVVIPNSNSERITHGVFYTAITRTKEKLKIFWNSNTMERIISGFNAEKDNKVSLSIIKSLLNDKSVE